jgi:hypothetical protein
MFIFILLLVAIAVTTYLVQFVLFSNSRNKVLQKDVTEIIDPTLIMDLSVGTQVAEV